ncbi:MAG: IS1 family transposase [Flavobacteriales bacterium]|nr:IS1 family transposase [Flavobacteriales bacterium]
MKECKYCKASSLISKGKRGIKQRYQCKSCGKYQQDIYSYKLYDILDDENIKELNAEGLGISSMSRILGYSKQTILRRILSLAHEIKRPVYSEYNQVYEVDELWTFIGKKHPSNYSWITYAINRKTHQVMNVVFGSRTKENLGKVIYLLKAQNPQKIITDKLSTYPNLVKPFLHETHRYANNHIERGNLTLRTHIKRLSRKTICFSKSQKMLEASVLLYFDFHNWRLKMN